MTKPRYPNQIEIESLRFKDLQRREREKWEMGRGN